MDATPEDRRGQPHGTSHAQKYVAGSRTFSGPVAWGRLSSANVIPGSGPTRHSAHPKWTLGGSLAAFGQPEAPSGRPLGSWARSTALGAAEPSLVFGAGDAVASRHLPRLSAGSNGVHLGRADKRPRAEACVFHVKPNSVLKTIRRAAAPGAPL